MDTLPTNESALAENIALKAQLAALVAELKEKRKLIESVNDTLMALQSSSLLPSAPVEDHFAKHQVLMSLKADKYASALHEIDNIARLVLKHMPSGADETISSLSRALEHIRQEVRDVYDVIEGI